MADESFEHTHKLENLLSPFCYESETPLPKTNPEIPGGIYLSGFISQDCTWGCCFNHSVIECFPVNRYFEDQSGFTTNSNSSSVAVSSSSYSFTGGRITCATELAIHNQRTSSGTRKLLLGISYTSENNRELHGALVIFDPIRCTPMKWIELPDPVSSVTVLSHFEEGGSNRPFFNETMMAMVGIAAVGLRGGAVIIVDLGLDDPNLTVFSSDMSNISSLTYRLLYVNPHEYVIATKRHKAVSKRSLISLKFANEPEDEMVSDAFHYCRPNGESILILQKNSVAVTCIEYVPAIGSLLVGFTCGGFQIWRVNNMELQYSSEPVHRERSVPVFGFGFQQPIDDPRNFCYVWVMYGNNSTECTNTFVELHSLLYDKKSYIENFGYTYDGFKQCTRRMEVPLIDDFLLNESDADDTGIRTSARPVRIWTQPESDLMFCTWEVGRGGYFYLGAFDLNQWYSNHTKECIVYHPVTGLCPYWVALPIEMADVSNVLLDVRMIPKSLIRWENPHNKQDVHLYPASLSFRAVCLTNTGVSAFEHFGIQEKLIRIVIKDGHNLMIQPAGLKNSFVSYGLEPVFQLTYGDHLSQKDRDRNFIFSVLLESRRTAAIIRLANLWLDGSYANVGCTIDLIIDWISSYMVAVRANAGEHWENLLNFPDESLPPETIRFINFSNFAWTLLHKLLLTLMNPSEVYSARGMELENIEFGLSKLVQYSSALLMLYKAKLLPESDPSVLKNLSEYYDQRRAEAKNALESSSYIDQQYKKSHPLMIDHLMDSLLVDEDLHEEWHVEEGQPLYPPLHIGYLANMFMWTDADPKAVARVFIYFLIDLNSFFGQSANNGSNSDAERKIRGNFNAVMDAAADDYHDIVDLWLLDNGFHGEILVHLKEKDKLYDNDGLPWCAATVALTAAGYEMDMSEMLLKSCPSSLAKLLFNLMSSSTSKYNTLAELMVTNSFSADAELLQQFFEVSDDRNCLGEFIQRKAKELSSDVREALLAFLKQSDSFKRLSQLLMYFIHLQDYQKLEEEFTRVRSILQYKNLPENEKRQWKFQECYIVHLLNTTSKRSVVENFLRLQSPPAVRQMKCISVPAIKAKLDETPPSTPKVFGTEHKLPPQLRRLKLCETISKDPLSPLRRYVGRMQDAGETTDCDQEKEEQSKSKRTSIRNARTSLSKSFSMRRQPRPSTSRVSVTDQPVVDMNESETNGELRLNASARNTSINIDLFSILRPPAIDHRLEKSRGMSFVANMTLGGMSGVDETLNQQLQPVQSIMKEKDSSKPKVMKKVELRFENMSLHSSDDDREVYEDADDNVVDETVLENDANTGFQTSFSSAVDTSMYTVESEAGAGHESEAEDISKIPASPEAENIDSHSVETEIELESVYGKLSPMSKPQEKADVSDIIGNVSVLSNTRILPGIEELEEEETVRGIFTPPKPPSSRSSTPSQSPVKEKHSPVAISSEKTEEISAPLTPLKTVVNIDDNELPGPSTGVRTRSSTSATPVRDIPLTTIYEDEKTPTQTNPTPPSPTAARPRRSSRSRTLSRDVFEEQSNEDEKTPTQTNPTPPSPTAARPRRSSRTRTFSREVSEEQSNEEIQAKMSQRMARKSRSRTPTENPSKPSKRVTRASKTPTREVPPESVEGSEEIEEAFDNTKPGKRRRVSKTPTREVPPANVESSEELEEVLDNTKRGKRRAASKTPTREVPPESVESSEELEEVLDNTKRGKRRRAASKTPTREVPPESVESSEELEEVLDNTKRGKRRRAASKTPTREVPPESVESSEEIEEVLDNTKPGKRRGSGKKAQPQASTSSQSQESFNFDHVFESSSTVDEESKSDEKPAKAKRSPLKKQTRPTKRRLKYFDHHQDLSTLIEDSSVTEASLMEATVLAPKVEPVKQQKNKRIKGIRQRPVLGEEEPGTSVEDTESESSKPTKRRKKAAVIVEDIEEEGQSEVDSHLSLRSNRSNRSSVSSLSSRKSAASGKGRGKKAKRGT